MTQSQSEGEKAVQPTPASAAESQTPNPSQDATTNDTAAASGGAEAAEATSKPDKETPNGDAANSANETAAEDKKDGNKGDDKPKDKTDDQNGDEVAATAAAAANAQPAYLANNESLKQLFDALPTVVEKAGHSEMWGVSLKDSDDPPTVIILMKYLRANEGDAKAASEQLTKSLEWRKKMDPLTLAEAVFPSDKFKDLGYVTTYDDKKSGRVVFTWNVYGSVKDVKKTFGDVDEFIKWRVALMELAIRELKIEEATTVMGYNGEDPFQMFQVHDYMNVSFLRMDPAIRKSSRETIEQFSMAYPELLKGKFFVNVPTVMGWVFGALKVLLSKNTVRKFHPLSNGTSLARELDGFGAEVPKVYGGSGSTLADQGRAPALTAEASKPAAPAEPEPAKRSSCQKKAQETSAAADEPAKSNEAAQCPAKTPAAASEEPAKADASEAPTAK